MQNSRTKRLEIQLLLWSHSGLAREPLFPGLG